jgi:hypothetical protein
MRGSVTRTAIIAGAGGLTIPQWNGYIETVMLRSELRKGFRLGPKQLQLFRFICEQEVSTVLPLDYNGNTFEHRPSVNISNKMTFREYDRLSSLSYHGLIIFGRVIAGHWSCNTTALGREYFASLDNSETGRV